MKDVTKKKIKEGAEKLSESAPDSKTQPITVGSSHGKGKKNGWH